MSATIESLPKVIKQKAWELNPEQWVQSIATKRMIKIDGRTYKELFSKPAEQRVPKETYKTNPDGWVINPETKKFVKIGGKTHQKITGTNTEIVKEGMVRSPKTNRWIKIDGKAYKKAQKEDIDFVIRPTKTMSL
jgi:hypothetical protein